MIGRPEWFTYRRFGWGIAPKKWQGWAYIAAFMAVVFAFSTVSYVNPTAGAALIIFAALVIIADTIDIMRKMKKVHDERQNLHQLIIERNVAWAGIAAIIAVILYQSIMFSITASSGAVPDTLLPFDWKLGAVLFVMVGTKAISSYYIERKM